VNRTALRQIKTQQYWVVTYLCLMLQQSLRCRTRNTASEQDGFVSDKDPTVLGCDLSLFDFATSS